MASTITIQDTISFCLPYMGQQPVFVNNLQPAIGIAQIVMDRILGSPFVWRFNRSNIGIAISNAGGTDYTQAVPQLGRIETQWLTDDAGRDLELGGAVSIAKNSSVRRPKKIAPVYDDNTGNITFRTDSVPDKNYTAYLDFQQKPPLITGPIGWGPVPDEFAHIFHTGFLTWASMLARDARFPIFEKWFIGSLLGAQDGLDEQAKNIFLGDWMGAVKTIARTQGEVQSGTAGRNQ